MNEILYHYCTIDTFLNIIKNNKIWLSDIKKSNDKEECLTCINNVNNKMKKYLATNQELLESWERGFELGKIVNSSSITFATCFSGSENLLSQWYRYADNGKGVAIGFDRKILEKLNEIHKYYIRFKKVSYKNNDKYIKSIVEDNIKKLNYKGAFHVAFELIQNYRLQHPFVKNVGFKEEDEWRVVLCSNIQSDNRTYCFPQSKEFQFSKIKYRSTNDKLIPYVEMNFEMVKQSIIKKIWIGPRSEMEAADIFNLMYFCGYYDNLSKGCNEQEPIEIIKSKTPYR